MKYILFCIISLALTVLGQEQRSGVSRIVVNKYKRETFTNDIALLQLEKPLKIDYKYVQPICLPDPKHRFLKGKQDFLPYYSLLLHLQQHLKA